MQTKRDARGIKTIYDYDALNRVTKRCYKVIGGGPLGATTCASAGGETPEPNTPDVTYFYDNLPNAKGRLIKVSSSVSTTEYTAFDILGRVTAHKQTTDGNAYTTGYVYNLSGALIEETYPSGRVVKNILDNDGDLSMVQSKKNQNYGFFTYANSFTYTAAGAVSSMQLGNGKWESTQFNSRLQSTQIALGLTPNATNLLKLDYSYGTTQNNGNVQSQTITVTRSNQSPLIFNQTYVYDSLNRLKSAEEKTDTTTNWKQTYTFDRYGNRNFDMPNTTQPSLHGGALPKVVNPEVLPGNNRLKQDQDGDSLNDYLYDAAGNLILDAEGRTFSYDAENKQKEVKNSSNQTIGQYFFDGDGKRVKKYVPGTGETTIFVYDANENLVAEYSTVVIQPSEAKVQYLTNDILGSPRIKTDREGNVISRTDYMPYGEEVIGLGGRSTADKYIPDSVRQGFTGHIEDEESNLVHQQYSYGA